jgi:hypothetical protein
MISFSKLPAERGKLLQGSRMDRDMGGLQRSGSRSVHDTLKHLERRT